MFCPKCKAEYREGFFICADCKVDLVSELPPEPEDSPEYTEYVNLVNIERYPSRHEAELAKGILSTNVEKQFMEQGGYSEQLAAARLAERERKRVRMDHFDQTDHIPQCPQCGKSMVLRAVKSGKNAGRQFWGCSAYPHCKGIVELE